MKSQAEVDEALGPKTEGVHRWMAILQVAVDQKQLRTIAKDGAIRFGWQKVISTSGGCVDCGGAAGEVYGEPCTSGPVEVTANPSAIHEMIQAILAMGGEKVSTDKLDNRWMAQCHYQGESQTSLGATEFAAVQRLAQKVRERLANRSAVGKPVADNPAPFPLPTPEDGPPTGPGLRRIK